MLIEINRFNAEIFISSEDALCVFYTKTKFFVIVR
jgi:hypothetical protein